MGRGAEPKCTQHHSAHLLRQLNGRLKSIDQAKEEIVERDEL